MPPGPPPLVEELLARAIAHANAGERHRALDCCIQAGSWHPPHPAVLQLLALLQMQSGELDHAAAAARASLALRPDHGPTLLIAGDIARAAGDASAALPLHRRAMALMPGRADAAHALGATLHRCGRPAEAEPVLALAVTLAPNYPDAWFVLALARQDLRDLPGAIDALQRVLRLAPRPEVEVNLGIVLQEAGRLDEAMQAYGRAWRQNPATFGRIAHALTAPGIGRLWLNLDDLREALRALPP